MTALDDVPYPDVTQKLYERLSHLERHEPGSERADITERAITLSLSPDRPPKDAKLIYLDVLSDARRAHRRGAARHNLAIQDAGQHAARGIPTGMSGGFVDPNTPETHLLAAELRGILDLSAHRVGAHVPAVLDGLLSDDPGPQTARCSDVSLATVNRARRTLRDAVRDAGYRAAA